MICSLTNDMQPYKGYFIAGSALLIHPFSPDWYVGGSVLVPGHSSSIVEIGLFRFRRFTVSIKELAEWFGLEVARIVVDECLAPPGTIAGRWLRFSSLHRETQQVGTID
jgi:hypothetical protein